MHAVVTQETGEPDVLRYEELDPPEPGDGEVLVRVAAASVNPAEQLARIAELVAAGDVRVEIAERLPLAEARRAHELSETGHVRGKIVLTVGA